MTWSRSTSLQGKNASFAQQSENIISLISTLRITHIKSYPTPLSFYVDFLPFQCNFSLTWYTFCSDKILSYISNILCSGMLHLKCIDHGELQLLYLTILTLHCSKRFDSPRYDIIGKRI